MAETLDKTPTSPDSLVSFTSPEAELPRQQDNAAPWEVYAAGSPSEIGSWVTPLLIKTAGSDQPSKE